MAFQTLYGQIVHKVYHKTTCGIPDFVDSDFEITKKQGIIRLGKSENAMRIHKILF